MQQIPLILLFERGLRFCEADAATQRDTSSYENAAESLQQVESRVQALGLYSPNEEIDDVTTRDLRYFLTPYLLGELRLQTSERAAATRKRVLQDALSHYSRFQHLAEQYGLIPPEARNDLETDAATRRQHKIARFQQEKAIKARLDALQGSSQLKSFKDWSEADEDEQEGEREAWLAKIQLAILKAAEQTMMLRQEIEMLQHADSMTEEERLKPPPPPPQDLLQQLKSAATALESRRSQLSADVFRPSHNLPTRSLQQQAAIELEQARRAEQSQARAQEARKALEADEDHQNAKERAWDDWKDDNPRGAGNSRLKPTA